MSHRHGQAHWFNRHGTLLVSWSALDSCAAQRSVRAGRVAEHGWGGNAPAERRKCAIRYTPVRLCWIKHAREARDYCGNVVLHGEQGLSHITPGMDCHGRGEIDSAESSSHGAGREPSRP
jgi:hypothetical protein